MNWFKKHEEPEYQVGDRVWISTFVNAYQGEIVGEAPPDIGSKSPRLIVRVEGKDVVVSKSFLSHVTPIKTTEELESRK